MFTRETAKEFQKRLTIERNKYSQTDVLDVMDIEVADAILRGCKDKSEWIRELRKHKWSDFKIGYILHIAQQRHEQKNMMADVTELTNKVLLKLKE